jgi:tripeptide aminopeptidase
MRIHVILPKIVMMFEDYQFTVGPRFLHYVTIDTQSDPESHSVPSTEKQKDLARLLVSELHGMGIANAELDHNGYVYAKIEANCAASIPAICFCAHMDTSPDCSGTGVRPIIHRSYNGEPIILPDDNTQVLTTALHPYLKEKIGDDIITASGTTLLGADDKAGIAIIMDMVAFLTSHPDIQHGLVSILFTPDEEIGRGVDYADLSKISATYAFTLDGGELGSYEDETFSADGVTVTIQGVSAHPGYAKGTMVNAIKVASEFVNSLPKQWFSPETTEGREGFVHPVSISGSVETATIQFIVRDFNTRKLSEYEKLLLEHIEDTVRKYPGSTFEIRVTEQYRNMREVIDMHPVLGELAAGAMELAGVQLLRKSARGGTDGSRLSFMGLPCPNIFTGEMAFHGKHEFISIQDMEKSVKTIVNILTLAVRKFA